MYSRTCLRWVANDAPNDGRDREKQILRAKTARRGGGPRFDRNDTSTIRSGGFLRPAKWCCDFASCAGDAAAARGFGEGAAELADVLRGLRGAAVQRAGADQHFECGDARSQVGLSDDGGREVRNDAAGC